MKPLSGNSSDAHEFGQVIQDHMAHFHTHFHGATYLVADSLYSAENLQKLAETRLKWITRVPATPGSPPSWPRLILDDGAAHGGPSLPRGAIELWGHRATLGLIHPNRANRIAQRT